jgi:hypothetical protein
MKKIPNFEEFLGESVDYRVRDIYRPKEHKSSRGINTKRTDVRFVAELPGESQHLMYFSVGIGKDGDLNIKPGATTTPILSKEGDKWVENSLLGLTPRKRTVTNSELRSMEAEIKKMWERGELF